MPITKRSFSLIPAALLLVVLSATGIRAQDRSVAAANRFAFKLLSLLTKDSVSNLVVAPPGVAMALGMIYSGAAESTAAELSRVLELDGMSPSDLAADYGQLRSQMKNLDRKVELLNANSLWVRKYVPLSPDYLKAMDKFYGARIRSLDFGKEDATKDINTWAMRSMNDKVLGIIDRTDPGVFSYLLNTFYFKGQWQQAFDPGLTRIDTFTLRNDVIRTIMMMNRDGQFDYFQGDGFQAAELPYGEGRVSMYVFLPDAASSLSRFLSALTPGNWNEWSSRFRSTSGTIGLPRFAMTGGTYLTPTLRTLGLDLTLDPNWADFTNMLAKDTFFAVSVVKQAAAIEVNEQGAAAVTPGLGPVSQFGFKMIMDQPFCFLIRDNQTGLILFAGVIRDPV
jgi:serine protease inhibitor